MCEEVCNPENMEIEPSFASSLAVIEKVRLGEKAKTILEYGRARELMKYGFNVTVSRYVEKFISPENIVIVGLIKK